MKQGHKGQERWCGKIISPSKKSRVIGQTYKCILNKGFSYIFSGQELRDHEGTSDCITGFSGDMGEPSSRLVLVTP